MSDFKKMLEQKRQAFDESQAEKAREADERRSQAKAIEQLGVELLKVNIIPVLVAARKELRNNGMDMIIKEDFDVAHFAKPIPKVSAKCASPARKSDGYRMESRPLIVEVNDGKCVIGFGKEYGVGFDDTKKCTVEAGDAAKLIQEMLLELTDEALKKLGDFHGPWD